LGLEKADKVDIELVNVFANLLAGAERSDTLMQVDRTMWQRVRDPRFAASYLVSLVDDGKKLEDNDVATILEQYSDNPVVSRVALSLAHEQKQSLTKPLARAIAAEYTSLTPNQLSATRTSDQLNTLFRALRQSLEE
jgi:phosphoribosylformylglycinamidine (FGAM) synthase PurS component